MRTRVFTLAAPVVALALVAAAPLLSASAEIEETPLTDEYSDEVVAEDEVVAREAGPGEKVEDSLDRAGEATHRGVEHGAEPVGRGLEKAMRATGKGIRKAIEKTGEGLQRAGDALTGNR